MSHNLTIHLGLHKTASGTLQRQFFPACSGLNLMTTARPEVRKFMELATRKDPMHFDAASARAVLEPLLKADETNLLSNEALSGPPYAGLIEYGLDHRSPIVANLKLAFPQARILLVLRRQDSLSKSLYRQYLKVGGTRSIKRFYGFDPRYSQPLVSLDRFLFSRYLELLATTFEAGCLFLTYEDFVSDQSAFLAKVCAYLGVELPDIELRFENATTLGDRGLEISRLANFLFRGLVNPGAIVPGIPTKSNGQRNFVSPVSIAHDRWPRKGRIRDSSDVQSIADRILELAKADNAEIDGRYGLELQRFGYC